MTSGFNIKLLLAIALTGGLAACSSGDIVVKSDLGEEMIIKEAAVTVSKIDREKAKKYAADTFKIWDDYSEERCRAQEEFLQSYCWSVYSSSYLPAKANLAAAASLPDLPYITYRSITKDVNGDKSASDYKHLLCLPENATQEQKAEWAKVAVYGVPAKQEMISTNMVIDGTVGSQASKALCEKYVKS